MRVFKLFHSDGYPTLIDAIDCKRVTVAQVDDGANFVIIIEDEHNILFFKTQVTGSCSEGSHGMRMRTVTTDMEDGSKI